MRVALLLIFRARRTRICVNDWVTEKPPNCGCDVAYPPRRAQVTQLSNIIFSTVFGIGILLTYCVSFDLCHHKGFELEH